MRKKMFNRSSSIFLAAVILFASAQVVFGQTRSRMVGRVTDAATGAPLVGANVIVAGTDLGSATDSDGRYIIINIPLGEYRVQAMMMGYEAQIISGVMVSLDRMSKVDFQMTATVIEGSVVEVVAERQIIHMEVANTQLVVNDAQLNEASGIREINSFLTKLPGVSEENGKLTIRGGSADQTGLMVNGFSYVNSGTGSAESSIPLSAIEQVSLLSGGYNAEYGNFRSGLINVTTKSGSKTGYHGTINMSRNQGLLKRFGKSFYDPHNAALKTYLDPAVAFSGTDPTFMGWDKAAYYYNIGKAEEEQATPLDYYLLAAWMHMVVPDYDGLLEYDSSYVVSDEQKQHFASHANSDNNIDWNIDGGFGGPVPFIGKALGDATFYISHNAREKYFIMPVTIPSDIARTTLLSIKSQPMNNLTLTLNSLYKYQRGISPIRPAWGDFPDASREGGFMPEDNIKYFMKNEVYWYDQPFFPVLEQTTIMNGLNVNHVINSSTFAELSLSAISISDDSPVGNNRDSTVITRFGPFPVTEMPYGKLQYGSNDVEDYRYPSYDALPGVNRRFRRKEGDLYTKVKIRQYRAKFDINAQVGLNHYLKSGIEYNYIDLDHVLWQKWNENYYNVYEFNYHRTPSQTGIYFQDQLTYDEIVANVGIRYDYYYGGGGKWPTGDPFDEKVFTPQSVADDSVLFDYLESGKSYIWDVWEAHNDTTPGFLQPIKNHHTYSPRLGISFPVTDRSKFYFNYGHFRSNPPYYTMYLYRYRYVKNGLYDMSNPNLEPPRTVSYELGVSTNFYHNLLLTVSTYYKDVTGQHGEVNYISSTGGLDYDKWANNEYEDIQGIELNLAKNDNSWLTGWVNLNYMFKKSGLVGEETITELDVSLDEDRLYKAEESMSVPVPKVNANITLHTPYLGNSGFLKKTLLSDWNFTFFMEWKKGNYFTWNPTGKRSSLFNWPDYKMVDLKVNKKFRFFGLEGSLFVDVSNLFNFKVSYMSKGYPFVYQSGDLRNRADFFNYIGSLHLSQYDNPDYDDLRDQYPGLFIAGDDEIGDLNSKSKDYIDDPGLPFWLYGKPREIWFGLSFSF